MRTRHCRLDNQSAEIPEARIVKGMVGREMTERFPSRSRVIKDEIALEVRNFTVYHELFTDRKVVDNVSLKVHKGEVVGIYGLIGAGRSELALSIFGQAYGTKASGTVYKDGKPLELNSVPDAIKRI